MTVAEQVQASAAQHRFLLDRLNELEDAPSELASRKACIKNFKADLPKAKSELATQDRITYLARKEHEDIKSSVGRKLAAVMTGQKSKFEEQQAKEESEYVQSLENAIKARNHVDQLKRMIEEAENMIIDLEPKAAEYDQRDKELHDLYSKIFDGLTQEYPQDDVLEAEFNKAKEKHSAVLHTLNTERQAYSMLRQACENLNECRSALDISKGYSTMDIWRGMTYTDELERSSLAKAQTCAMSAQLLLKNAATLSQHIQGDTLDDLYIVQGNIMSDVVFDDIFTQSKVREKIRDSAVSSQKIAPLLEEQQKAAAERIADLSSACDIAKTELLSAREELDRFRRSIFEGGLSTSPTARNGMASPAADVPPPEYS